MDMEGNIGNRRGTCRLPNFAYLAVSKIRTVSSLAVIPKNDVHAMNRTADASLAPNISSSIPKYSAVGILEYSKKNRSK